MSLVHVEKLSLNCSKFVVCNLCKSCLSLTILVYLWSIITSLVCFHLSEISVLVFLQFKCNTVGAQNN